jgi:MFS family permease
MTRWIRFNAWQGLQGNLPKSMLLAFFQVFLVIIPIIVPYFQQHGLSMQQVFLTQAWFGAVVVIMEIPSGVLADQFGRKKALVLGTFFLACGHLSLLWADSLTGFLIFEGLLGIGVSLISGADLALLYDTELALNRVDESPRAVANLYTMHSASEAIAAIACSLLLLVSIHAVVVIQVIAGCLPMLIAMTLVEPDHKAGREHEPLRFAEVLKHLVANGSIMRWTVLSLSLWSLTNFFAVWILQRYWFEQEVPLALFGYLWAGYTAIAGLAGRWAVRTEARLGITGLLVLIGLLPVLGYVGLATMPLMLALVVSIVFFVARGLGLVVLRDALNRRTPSHFRATANSMASFGFRAAFVVAGPAVGVFMDVTDLTATLWLLALGSALISAGVLVPLWRAIGRVEPNSADAVPTSDAPDGRDG